MAPVTLALIGARLRAAGGRHLAVVAALATAAVIPVVVAASAAVTADGALGRGLGDLPIGERSVIVSYNGFLDRAEAKAADTEVRTHLTALISGSVRRQVEYRALADSAGRTFALAGTDDLASAVRITSGRLPRSCEPSRCEVIVIAAGNSQPPQLRAGYGVVVVGQAVRTDPLLLSGTFDPGPTVPIVLADGVDAAAGIEPLALIQRSYGWVAPLDRSQIRDQGVENWISTAADTADRLWLTRQGLVLTTPDAAISDQSVRADASARRFGLLAGSCAVILLGTAFVGGAALRPDQVRFVSALRRRGLPPAQIRLVVAGETLMTAAVAAVAGLLIGTVAAAALAARAGLPVTATALDALWSALPFDVALAVAAFALLVVTLWPRTDRPEPAQERTAWQVLSGTVVIGLLAVLLTISRGKATATDEDPLTVLLPALVLLTLGLCSARAWPWAVLVAFRLLPRRAIGARLAVAGICARPLLAAATVGLLAAAVGATGFSASYRSTLLQGAVDQAAFAVPVDARVVPGNQLAPVLSLAAVADYQGIVPGTRVAPALRQAGSIRSSSQQAEVVQVLGLDPSALGLVQRWSNVVGTSSADVVAAAMTVPKPAAAGLRLPAGKTLRVGLGTAAPQIDVTGWLRADDGRERSIPLANGPGRRTLIGTLPSATTPPALSASASTEPALVSADSGPWSLVALTLSQPTDQATHRQHGLGEGDTGRSVPAGQVQLRSMDVDGTAVAHPWQGWSAAGLTIAGAGDSAVLDYRLEASSLVMTALTPGPGDPDSGVPLPVAADPLTAAAGPLLTLTLNGSPVRARVVATLPRFPTVTGRFVVADRSALSSLVDRTTPGAGQPGELWLDVPGTGTDLGTARARLSAAPFTGVAVQWSADLGRDLRTDPVAQGAVQLLLLVAVLTMLVALAALVLLVIGERVEDADEFYLWEANGVPPSTLRIGLWVRAVLVALLGVPLGVGGGLILTRLTARLVDLTAGAQGAQPPLVAVSGVGNALLAVLIGLALALAIAGLVALRSFREPQPRAALQ